MSDLASLLGLRPMAAIDPVESAESAYARGLAEGELRGAQALDAALAQHHAERASDARAFAAALEALEQAFADALLPLLKDALARLVAAPALADAALLCAASALSEEVGQLPIGVHPSRIPLLSQAFAGPGRIVPDASLPTDMIEIRVDGSRLIAGVGLRLDTLLHALDEQA